MDLDDDMILWEMLMHLKMMADGRRQMSESCVVFCELRHVSFFLPYFARVVPPTNAAPIRLNIFQVDVDLFGSI